MTAKPDQLLVDTVVEMHRSPSARTPMCPPTQGPHVGVDTTQPASTKISARPSLMHCM